MEYAVKGWAQKRAMLSPTSDQNPFRAKRVADIAALCRGRAMTRIIDLGGTPDFWNLWRHHIDWTRVEITCVNLTKFGGRTGPVTCIQGDATDLHFIDDKAFDIAFSNSVIEHVGRDRMARFAAEASRVAQQVYIQTPDYWFPIEAHSRLPAFQWLPKCARAMILRTCRVGFFERAPTYADAVRAVEATDLLTAKELATLFPHAEIRREWYMGLSKALIAVG